MSKVKRISCNQLTANFYYRGRSFNSYRINKLVKIVLPTIEVLEKYLKNALKLPKKAQVSFDFVVCGNQRIKTLNRDYRNINKTTDVLSFPLHHNLLQKKNKLEILHLGDIFVAAPVAQKQAERFAITFEVEVVHLLLHGLLHLVGYDHERSKRADREMCALEKKLLGQILRSLKNG